MAPKKMTARPLIVSAVLGVAIVGSVALSHQAQAAQNYVLCGGSPGGLWSLLGAGMDKVVKAVDPAATVTYQTSSGGFANIVQLEAGTCDMAIVHVGEAVMAMNGTPPFEAPTTGFAAVAVLYDWAPMQWLVSEEFADEYGLTSIADIASSGAPIDLVVNRRGILPSILAEEALTQAGVTFEEIEENGGSIQYHGSETAASVMKDRKADAWVNAMFIGTGAIRDIAETVDLTMLSVPEDVIDHMAKTYGSLPTSVPADAYDWLEADVATFGARAALVVSDAMDGASVEAITRALVDNIEEMRSVHGSMEALTVDVMRSASELPYHPGAEAAYREAKS